MIKTYKGEEIPFEQYKDEIGFYIYKECKFAHYFVTLEGRGWDDGWDDECFRNYQEITVYYDDERDLVDIINYAKKLFTETSYYKNIDDIINMKMGAA
jgi:hypothetical protein